MIQNILNDDTKTEAVPAVFTGFWPLAWPPKRFMLSCSLPPGIPRLFTAHPQPQYFTL